MKQQNEDNGRTGRQRYYPEDRRDENGHRYQSGGYQEEQGDFGEHGRRQGPDRQSRSGQAEPGPYGEGGPSYGSGRFWRSGEEHWQGQGGEMGRADQNGGQQGQRGFRGRGPKGYQRSDDRLREVICEKLTDDDRIDAGEVSVEVKNGEVKLTGTVSDRQTKYHIEELVEDCTGVKDVDNQLRVNRSQDDAGRKAGAERAGKKAQQGASSQGATTGGAGI